MVLDITPGEYIKLMDKTQLKHVQYYSSVLSVTSIIMLFSIADVLNVID